MDEPKRGDEVEEDGLSNMSASLPVGFWGVATLAILDDKENEDSVSCGGRVACCSFPRSIALTRFVRLALVDAGFELTLVAGTLLDTLG